VAESASRPALRAITERHERLEFDAGSNRTGRGPSDGEPGVTRPRAVGDIAALALRVRGEFAEMPGLRLTVPQAARLFGLAVDVAHAVLDELRLASVLTCSNRGAYSPGRYFRGTPLREGTERRLNDG